MSFWAWMVQSKLVRCSRFSGSLLLKAFQANLESCQKRLPSETQSTHIKSLGGISMELMQKYTKDNGMVGVDDLDRWPVDSDAVGFLSAISTTTSIEALKQVISASVPLLLHVMC
jgi:hypothetical protein